MATISGTNGFDNLKGTSDPDLIKGFGDVDNLTGGLGADTLDGGFGDDRAIYSDSNAAVTVILGGSNQGSGSGGIAQGDVLISIENVTGSFLNDAILGDEFDNNIDGGGGFDTLKGGGGADFLRGSGQLEGGEDNDTLRGGALNDSLFGGDGDDTLDGREGADLMDGGAGIDEIVYEASDVGVIVNLGGGTNLGSGGDAEGDTYVGIEDVVGSSEDDVVADFGGIANRFDGGTGDDNLKGGGGADRLNGEIGNDTLEGGEGNDTLEGGFDGDRLDGGAGIDSASYFEANVGVTLSLASGGTGGQAQGDTFVSIENVEGSFENDHISGDGGANVLFGNLGNDTLKGAGGSDTLVGDVGNDVLVGGDGDDKLDGQSGTDQLQGSAGNDTYSVDAQDTVDETTGSGIDTVLSRQDFSLSSSLVKGSVENLTLLGAANISAVGNALANTITGNSGSNNVNGNSGADLMRGMGGSDHYVVNEAGDVVDESVAGSGGVDDVFSFVSLNLSGANMKGTIENATLAVSAQALNLTGNAVANELNGNGNANVIAGMLGNDELTGKGGADSFLFNTAPNGATNRDVITDFTVPEDTIRLENAVYTALAQTGTLAASAFRIGKAAQDANDRIIYDDDFGSLFYDADGTGAKAAVRFAIVDDGLAMTNLDFLVV
jgi:Ca2+-binding RTX toxin-like protein